MNREKLLFKLDLFNIYQKYIINNFKEYLNNKTLSEFIELSKNKKFAKMITNNDLFFKHIDYFIKKNSKEDKTEIEYYQIKNNPKYLINILKNIYNFDKNYLINNLDKLLKNESLIAYEISSRKTIDTFYSDLLANFCFDILKEQNIDVMDYLIENNIYYFSYNYNFCKIYSEKLKKEPNYLEKNHKYFIKTFPFFQIKQIIKEENIKFNEDLFKENSIQKNKIITEMILDSINLNYKKLESEKIIPVIEIMVDELVNNEKTTYDKIEKIGSGQYSTAFKIGNKVLKIGEQREIFELPNHKRFLQPLFRKEIRSLTSNKILCCIEITEYTNTKDITDEEVYQTYKDLRNNNLFWFDIKKDNLGRLTKDNTIHFENIKNIPKEAISYTTELTEEETLQKGDVVIIDNDRIYTQKSFRKNGYTGKIEDGILKKFPEFEKRYLEEKENNSKNKR